jgi:hypothetical protein
MVDSCPNLFCTAEHILLRYPRGSNLLSWFAHRFLGDKQN